MSRRFVSVLVLASAVGSAAPALAQAPTPASAPSASANQAMAGPIVNLWYVGGAVGAGVVDSASVTGNVEAGFRLWKSLDLLVEGGYGGNLATRREIDRAGTIAASVSATQGSPVTATVSVPSSYAAVGARWVFESASRFRPYVLIEVGGAAVDLKPKFVLNGADVTGSLSTFGVTLGSDISGKYRPLAFGGGVGVVSPLGKRWSLDGSLRILSVNTTDQRTNLTRLTVGIVRRF